MKGRAKLIFTIFLLSALLPACTQPTSTVTPAPLPTPTEAPTSSETPVPLTLAGQELFSATMADYSKRSEEYPYWSDYRTGQEAGLEDAFQEWGFDPELPFFEYHGEDGADLIFYYDETQDRGLGIFEGGYGFGLNKSFPENEAWDDWKKDPMSPPEHDFQEDWTDFREEREYDEDGRLICLDLYANTGDSRFEDPTNCWIYGVEYVYDRAGTLRYKHSYENFSLISYANPSEFWYDELGRLIYAEGYITHGRYHYYYIYQGDSPTPAYLLWIDRNLNYADPTLIRYLS